MHNAFCFAWLLLFDLWQLFWAWKFGFRSAVHKKFRWWHKFFSGNASATRKWDTKSDLNSLLNHLFMWDMPRSESTFSCKFSFFLKSEIFDSRSQKCQPKLLLNPILIKVYKGKEKELGAAHFECTQAYMGYLAIKFGSCPNFCIYFILSNFDNQ